MNQLTTAVWYLDAHHDTLRERGLRVPKELAHLSGFNEVSEFNDWQKKIRKPQLSGQGLDGHVQNLSRLVSQSWLSKTEYSQLRAMIESLNDVYNYKEYFLQQRK